MSLDDYLGLLSQDLSGVSTVIFAGPSGSGKTSQIRLLLDRHDDFRHLSRYDISPQAPGFSWRACRARLAGEPLELLVVDEIATLLDALHVRRLLPHVPRQVIASHIAPRLIRGAGPRVRHIDTARGSTKLARYLDRLGVDYTHADLQRYVARYGAVFTELQIMLEVCPAPSLAQVWEMFHRFYSIRQGA